MNLTKTLNRQIHLARYPDGVPAEGDFELAECPLPEAGEGQLLLKTRYLSLDPYMRSQIAGRHLSGSLAPGDMMRGESVCEVVESRDAAFSEGSLVRCMGGWQEYTGPCQVSVSRFRQ